MTVYSGALVIFGIGENIEQHCYFILFLANIVISLIFGHWYDVVSKCAGPLNPIIIEVVLEGNKPCFRELNYWHK